MINNDDVVFCNPIKCVPQELYFLMIDNKLLNPPSLWWDRAKVFIQFFGKEKLKRSLFYQICRLDGSKFGLGSHFVLPFSPSLTNCHRLHFDASSFLHHINKALTPTSRRHDDANSIAICLTTGRITSWKEDLCGNAAII